MGGKNIRVKYLVFFFFRDRVFGLLFYFVCYIFVRYVRECFLCFFSNIVGRKLR